MARSSDRRNPTSRETSSERHSAACNVAIPARDLDAQWQRLEAKFRSLASPLLGAGRVDVVIGQLRDLEAQPDLRTLTEALEVAA